MKKQSKKLTVYISKLATTRGVLSFDAEYREGNNNVLMFGDDGRLIHVFYGEGVEWHRTRLGAEEDARKRIWKRVQRIKDETDRLTEILERFES